MTKRTLIKTLGALTAGLAAGCVFAEEEAAILLEQAFAEAVASGKGQGEDEEAQHQRRTLDRYAVTNAQFRKFVEATKYVTTAERKPDWDSLRVQLPPGTPLAVTREVAEEARRRIAAWTTASAWWSAIAPTRSTERRSKGRRSIPRTCRSWDSSRSRCGTGLG